MNTTLINSTAAEVVYVSGKKETVSLNRLTIRQLYTWARLLKEKNMPALVCLCAGKPEEWIDELADESLAKLAERCVAINFQRAKTISESDPVMASMLGPVLAEATSLMRAALVETRGIDSLAPLPEPARSESAAENGNGSSI